MKKNEEIIKDYGAIKPEIMPNMDTELVFIIDRSGSMSGFEDDTIGGFNSMIEKQKYGEGKVYISTVLFDNYSEVIHDRELIEHVQPMTRRNYQVRGCTALLDAIGGAIHHIGNVHKYARREDVPSSTIFVITTDGMENASQQYSSQKVKEMIERQTEKYGWEFIFLAANIDAIETADNIGIRRERAANYKQSKEGYVACYEAVNAFCLTTRNKGNRPMECIEEDAWKKSLKDEA